MVTQEIWNVLHGNLLFDSVRRSAWLRPDMIWGVHRFSTVDKNGVSLFDLYVRSISEHSLVLRMQLKTMKLTWFRTTQRWFASVLRSKISSFDSVEAASKPPRSIVRRAPSCKQWSCQNSGHLVQLHTFPQNVFQSLCFHKGAFLVGSPIECNLFSGGIWLVSISQTLDHGPRTIQRFEIHTSGSGRGQLRTRVKSWNVFRHYRVRVQFALP